MNITEKAKGIIDSCRFCWMCRHICPVGNATGQERNTARARALAASMVVRGAMPLSEICDNVYECTLCGACTNNCMTGWDPKVFIQELKTEIILQGAAPEYIVNLLQGYAENGNIYGEKAAPKALKALCNNASKTLFFAGQNAIYRAPECVATAMDLLNKAGVKASFDTAQNSGADLWFLTGKTAETQEAATQNAKAMNAYDTVIVYDPADLAFILHQYKEWGIDVTAKVIGFNQYLLDLIQKGALKVKKGNNAYTLQDNHNYARELDDSKTAREIIAAVGCAKEVLLIGKESNLAGQAVMNEYLPKVMPEVAKTRWQDALRMDCNTFVTECPAEYTALKATAPAGCRVLSVEQMIAENL